ncbi:MAG TPA: hypothetical protein VF753_03885 [Terriglobales bacterium]
MQNWKKALIAGSAAGATVMFAKRKNSLGLLLVGVAVGTVASEYPQEFKRLRRRLPDYLERGSNLLEMVSSFGERIADAAGERGTQWYEALMRR